MSVEETQIKVVDSDIAAYITNQREINEIHAQNMKNQLKKNAEIESKMDRMLSLLEANRSGQSSSKSIEAIMGSGTGKTAEDTLCSKKKQIGTDSVEVVDDDSIELLKDNERTLDAFEDEQQLWASMDDASTVSASEVDAERRLDALSDEDLEAIISSEYSELMSQTEEKLGKPVNTLVAEVCKRTWGKSILSKEKKEELLKGLEVPANCKVLRAPKLNTAIFIRVRENDRSKDMSAASRQRNISSAVNPLLHGMGDLEGTKAALKSQLKATQGTPKDLEEAKSMLAAARQQNKVIADHMAALRGKLNKSVMLLNYNFTETTRKRKTDICNALGSAFKPHINESTATGENLFDDETMKNMKTELKKINVKPLVKASPAKNGSSFGKAPRSHQYQGNNSYNKYGNQKRHYDNSQDYNNNNNNNKYSPHNKRRRGGKN